jgi:TusA-related sulfurtransferase
MRGLRRSAAARRGGAGNGRGDLLADGGRAVTPSPVVDLRPFACPLTYVKTRIALERIRVGERLEVWLAAGEAVESVPRSASEEGHRVVAVEPLAAEAGAFRVLLEKGSPAPGGPP